MQENEDTDIRTENPYTVRRESVQPGRTLVKARRRPSLSYPDQAPLIPYRTTDIEIDSNESRPLNTGHSEATSRTSTPTLQKFTINSPEFPSESSIATPTTSELQANPFYQPTRQQTQNFNLLQQQFRATRPSSPHSSFWSASSRDSISSSKITPRLSLTLSTHKTSLEENASQNTYSQMESLIITDQTSIPNKLFEPEIRLPENYRDQEDQ